MNGQRCLGPGWAVPFLTVFAVACGPSAAQRQAIREWLACQEGCQSRLGPVTSIGNDAVPLLASALRHAPTQEREDLRRRLIEAYDELGLPPAGQATYVARYLGNFDALYQTHAAVALSTIRTPLARATLRRALDSSDVREYRADVFRAVQDAFALVAHDAFTGLLVPDTVDYLDTVRVSEGSGQPWDGNEGILVVGSPFPKDLVVARDVDSLKFLAVIEPGTHSVLVTNLGPPRDTQVASFHVERAPYLPHAPATAPDLTAGAFPPDTIHLALGTRVTDTTDYFRLAPGAVLPVTANVDWTGLSSVTLSWRSCTSPFPLATLPGNNTVTGVVVDSAGGGVGAAQVLVTGTALMASTTGSGEFTISSPTLVGQPQVTLRVSRIGFRVGTFVVQPGSGSHVLTLLRSGVTDATARNRRASSLEIAAGACRLLQILASGPELVRLRFTSP